MEFRLRAESYSLPVIDWQYRQVLSIDFDALGMDFSDEDLLKLTQLQNLYSIKLNGTRITDDGLFHLEKLTKLEYLSVSETQVTPAGVAKLKVALPACETVGP